MLNSKLSYWKKKLSGKLPVLEVPPDRARPAVQTYNGAMETEKISVEQLGRLKELCQQEGVTLFMVLIAAFKILLYRYTNVDDIISALHKEGLAILLIEQNAHTALNLADIGYVVENGRIITSGKASELLQSDQVKKAYLGA